MARARLYFGVLVRACASLALGCFTLAAPALGQSPRPAFAAAGTPPSPAAPPAATTPASSATPIEEEIVDVRIVGNRAITTTKVLDAMKCRKGRPFDQRNFENDVRTLATKGWFLNVKPQRETAPGGGVILTFQVIERPTLEYVTYVGNIKVKSKTLAKKSELKKGDSLDPYSVEEGRRKIDEYYKSKGYNDVQVTVMEGSKVGDRGAIYLINEGQPQKVWHVEFKGNTIASASRLRTQVESKHPVVWIFKGYVDRKKIDEDVNRLRAYYTSLGFFKVRIGRELEWNEKQSWLTLTFVIDEGPRYKIRNIALVGNTKFETDQLSETLGLKVGEFFDQAKMTKDQGVIRDIYGSQGYVFADVKPETRLLEEPGELDLVYDISEGGRYRVSRIDVHIGGENPHTRHNTVLNRLNLRPGDIVDIRKIRDGERRLKASQLFQTDPSKGDGPKITFSPPELDEETGVARRRPGNPDSFRGQSPDGPPDRWLVVNASGKLAPRRPGEAPPADLPAEEYGPAVGGQLDAKPAPPAPPPPVRRQAAPEQLIIRGQSPAPAWRNPLRGFQSPAAVPAQQPLLHQPPIIRGQGPAGFGQPQYGGQPMGSMGPDSQPRTVYQNPPAGAPPPPGPFTAPAAPQEYIPRRAQPAQPLGPPILGIDPNQSPLAPGSAVQPGPDQGGLAGEPTLELPLDVRVEETQTGKFMFGVGVNSNAGVVGSIVVDESNFDWRRWPRGFDDFRNGTAFRGAGQRFRIEAAPGTQVQRYMLNFQEPYLFDTPVTFGLSGMYYNRYFRDWTETRLGSRVSLGYQLTPDFSGTIALRAENIGIANPRVPTPDLTAVLGHSQIYSINPTIVHDTRDNTFLATEGHYIQVGFEQAFGTFQFPRATADFRQYFLLRERPDTSGRHVLSLISHVGVSGKQTPIYERFFAGGYSTIRGFQFRGASPVVDTVQVGGDFEWYNTVEYLFPITADDMLRGVTFVDFGTVEQTAHIDPANFRVAPGVGLRVTIPMLGPAPIALDLAFPVHKAPTDTKQIFSFFVGFGR